MTKKPTFVLAILLAPLLVTTLAVGASGPPPFILVNGMVEGPDPIPTDWESVLSATAGETPDFGLTENDFPADVAYEPQTGLPAVVWEYPSGGDLDIAFSAWSGDGWDRTEFLSSSTHDERDPRLAFDDSGVAFVVWWQQADAGYVFVARRTAGGIWMPASSRRGARPEIAVHEGETYAVYERAFPRGNQVRYMRITSAGEIEDHPLARTEVTEATRVRFHRQDGRLWLLWQHTPTQVAWSELVDGLWVAPASLP